MEPATLAALYAERRGELIEEIRAQGVEDLEILQLFDRVPRHLFVPEAMRARAYENVALPIGHGQTLSQASLHALTLQLLRPAPDDRVLEIGTGSGFLTALLACMAGRVYSVERIRDLSVWARRILDELGVTNTALLVGDGTLGWRRFAPYSVIVVCAAAPAVPEPLLEQLADPGRMLVPLGPRQEQRLALIQRRGGRITEEAVAQGCWFVPLLGRHGWESGTGRAARP